MALVIVCTAVNAGGDLFGFEPPEITSIMADDFLPDANNTYDLGSYDFSWKDIYASGTAYIGGVNIPDVYTAKEEPTGFVNKDNVITWDDATRTISIAGDHDIYIHGKRFTMSATSTVIPDVSTQHIAYYDANGVLQNSTVFPGLDLPLMSTLYWNSSSTQGFIGEERHGIVMDYKTHEILHQTVGTAYEGGFTATFDDTTFTIGEGTIHDEDIEFIHSATTTADIFYKNGSTAYEWDDGQTNYMKLIGGNVQYNNGNDLEDVPTNQYSAMWIFATNNLDKPISAILGQRTDTTLASARQSNTLSNLSLGTLPTKEMKILYRVLLRNDATPYVETQDLRAVQNLPSGTYTATGHDSLTNLLWTSSGHNDTVFNVDVNNDSRVGIGTDFPGTRLTLSGGDFSIGDGSATTTLDESSFIFNDTASDSTGVFNIESSGNVNSSGTLSINGLGRDKVSASSTILSAGWGATTTIAGDLLVGGQPFTSLPAAFWRDGSVVVGGNLQVNNRLEQLGTVRFHSSFTLLDNIFVQIGNSTDAKFGWNTTQTPDAFHFSSGQGSNSILITEDNDFTFDFKQPNRTDPTIIIHSTSTSNTGLYGEFDYNHLRMTSFDGKATTTIQVSDRNTTSTMAFGMPDVELATPGHGTCLKLVAGDTGAVFYVSFQHDGNNDGTADDPGFVYSNDTSCDADTP